MIVPDKILKCVVYLGIRDIYGVYRFAGTAVLIGRIHSMENGEPLGFSYLLTAKHVIDGVRKTLVDDVQIRFNIKDSTAVWVPSKLSSWIFHPDDPSIDLAVVPMINPPPNIDHIVYPIEEILSDTARQDRGIGLGDEVFLAGLFSHSPGEKRSIPIIRTGSIAALPEERIATHDFGKMAAYLLELRSMAGISGSPVFAYISALNVTAGRVQRGDRNEFSASEFYLLGLVHGHFDSHYGGDGRYFEELNTKVSINVGIAIVVPGESILKVLDQPSIRMEEERELKLQAIQRNGGSRTRRADDWPMIQMNPEEIAIANLREKGAELPSELMDALLDVFGRLRTLEIKVSRSSPTRLYEAMWAVLGLMSRSYEFMLCGIDQLASRNFNGSYAAIRGLVESLAAVVWASQSEDRLPALVQSTPVGIGKIMNAGYSKYPDLRRTYAELSGIVHPKRDGHMLSPVAERFRSDLNIWSPFELHFPSYYATRKLLLLKGTSERIVNELESMITLGPEVIHKGRIMAEIRIRSPRHDGGEKT